MPDFHLIAMVEAMSAGRELQTTPTAVPTQAQIDRKASSLSNPEAATFRKLMASLGDHLGSPEAARLWLVTPSSGFETTPLDAIVGGEVESVFAYLKSRWGPGPVYA